ncbi:hypothetical protein [Dankookia sp. P2]|uniref:hypothetical protein n=1 Tax=Dankookia sp. P2 TaxID=3423955 RepID=UPI003D668E41
MSPVWRQMTRADLPAVQALADRLHPHHPESPAVIAERLVLAAAGCRVLAAGEAVLGYAITHPWTGTAPPPLDSAARHAADAAGRLAHPRHRARPRGAGRGHAAAVLRAMLGASPWPRATLVAIPGTGEYWGGRAFAMRRSPMPRPWPAMAQARGSWRDLADRPRPPGGAGSSRAGRAADASRAWPDGTKAGQARH